MFQTEVIHSKIASYRKIKKPGIFLPILLLLISNLFIYNFIISKQYSSSFYQNEFSPAVMLACGYQFANPAHENIDLQSFLQNKTNSFECKNIDHKALAPLNYFQRLSSYMLISAGLTWKVFGIGWDNLIPLFLFLYSMTLLALYFIFRLGMNQYFAFLFSLLIAHSSLQMHYIMQLRDYSVAPFLLWLVWIAGKLVTTNTDTKKLMVFSGLAGVVLGIGLGFRIDLLVLVPFFILVLLFFVKLDRNTIPIKLVGIIVFLVSFIIVASPILSIMRQQVGGDLSHVIILGLADSFTTSLGLQQPETYSIIPAYRDLIPYTAVNSFSQRIYGIEKLIPTATKDYSYFSSLFLLHYVHDFPADFLIRIYASIVQIPSIFIYGYLEKNALNLPLRNIVLGIPIFTTAMIALYQPRIALFILFALIYLGAYPVLQFDPRHYFYLEFIGWWFIGFLSQQIIFLIVNRFDSEFLQDLKSRIILQGKRIFIVGIMGWIILFGFIILLRFYQTNHLNKLYNNYLSLKSKTIEPVINDDNKFIIKFPAKSTKNISHLETIYLKISTQEQCSLKQILLKLHYLEEPPKFWEVPQELIIPTDKAMTYFIPIYNYHNAEGKTIINEAYLPSYWIDYLAYSLQDSFCIKNIAYLKKIDTIPLLLTLKLKTGWENDKLYQSFCFSTT